MDDPSVITNRNRLFSYLVIFSTLCLTAPIKAEYRVGVGIADATGPVVEIGFMGYAKALQKGSGLHLRQFARAFIIEDGTNRIAFVSVDCAMVGYGIRKQVLQNLASIYNSIYTEQNFILSATHTHSAPGGAMMHILFDFTTFGFVHETFSALVEGIVQAVIKAHESVQKARIYINSGELLNANINRSPLAYILNPEEERLKYDYNTDKEMVQLKFISTATDKLLGSIQWFAVHPTSMNNTNTLVSSDNLGYASILLEKHINKGSLPGKGKFVGAFASANLGDVSPNLRGPHCLNNGEPCDDVTSSCDGVAQNCVAFGPGTDMLESTKILAERLYKKAVDILNDGKSREVKGPLKFGHQYVHMSSQVIQQTLPNGTVVTLKGCASAMGYSFAAGTTDGPGEFDFKQGTVTSNTLWNLVRNAVAEPTPEDIDCHHPKPILLLTGKAKFPYEWQPKVVSVQVAILGEVILAAVPGEFTTMSGRRLRNALKEVAKENHSGENTKVIIAGLSNAYSDYIVTPEEYQLQRYEAASTIYGPNTLPIYIHLFTNLTETLYKDKPFDAGPAPKDISKQLISLVLPVIYDGAGIKLEFGDCIIQPQETASVGDVVSATFVAGNPRNNAMHGKTFLAIEKLLNDDDWEVVATDADWETKFIWKRISHIAGSSHAIIEWTITSEVGPGTYRIRHYGYYKYILGGIFPYEGLSRNFRVL